DSEALLPIAAALSKPGAELAGVLTHAGHSYHARTIAEIRHIAEDERAAVVKAAQRLREAGHPCPIVSLGSTPTEVHADSLAGGRCAARGPRWRPWGHPVARPAWRRAGRCVPCPGPRRLAIAAVAGARAPGGARGPARSAGPGASARPARPSTAADSRDRPSA